MAGFRVYGPIDKPLHKRYICKPDGTPVKGQYPAILDEDTWRKVVAVLAGPNRRGAHNYSGKRKYLLSGIIRCGECGIKLRGGAQRNNRHAYACKPPMVDGGCGKVCGSGIAIDEFVTDLVLSYLADHRFEATSAPWPGKAALDEATKLKTNLLDQFKANPDMGPYIWPRVRDLDATIIKLANERAAHDRKTAKPRLASVAETWKDLEVEQRQAVICEVIEAVVLTPATRNSNRFDEARLSVIWRQEVPQDAANAA
jgi:hypothetical protein